MPSRYESISADKLHCLWPARALLGEGPLWSEREQALYWTDILGRKLHRYTPESGEQRTWPFDEFICTVAERELRGREGNLIVTLHSGFAFFDTETATLTPLHDPEPTLESNRFNDGKVDPRGRLWAGTMDIACKAPTGSLYRFDTQRNCVRWESGYAVSNGPVWSLDGATMYHNDTVNGGVYAYDFDAETGEASNRRLFLQIDPVNGYPDGMTVDAQGGLWIAHFSGARVVRFLADGSIDRRIDLPTSDVTSCTFGGPGLRTLFITTSTAELSEEQRAKQPLAGSLFACEPEGLHGVPARKYGG
jgi:sugar lactone lactonase YvrE